MNHRLLDLIRAIDHAVDSDDHRRALQLILHNWFHLPDPAPLRERTALVLASRGRRREAVEIYRLVARHYANSGFPCRSLAAIKQMLALNPSSTQLLDHFTTLYSVRSPFLDRNLPPATLPQPASQLSLKSSDSTDFDTLVQWATERATDRDTIADRPGSLPAVPLLSLLPPRPLRRLLDHLQFEIFADAQPLFDDERPPHLYWTVSPDFRLRRDDSTSLIAAASLLGIDHFLGLRPASEITLSSSPGSQCLQLSTQAFDTLTEEFADFPNRVATLHRHALTRRLLHDHPLFAPLDDSGRRQLSNRLTGLRIERGTPLLRRGKVCPGLYLILDGTVRLSNGPDDAPNLPATLEPGDSLGETGLADPRPALFDATADDDLHLLFLSQSAFTDLASDHPDIDQRARALAERRRHQLAPPS